MSDIHLLSPEVYRRRWDQYVKDDGSFERADPRGTTFSICGTYSPPRPDKRR